MPGFPRDLKQKKKANSMSEMTYHVKGTQNSTPARTSQEHAALPAAELPIQHKDKKIEKLAGLCSVEVRSALNLKNGRPHCAEGGANPIEDTVERKIKCILFTKENTLINSTIGQLFEELDKTRGLSEDRLRAIQAVLKGQLHPDDSLYQLVNGLCVTFSSNEALLVTSAQQHFTKALNKVDGAMINELALRCLHGRSVEKSTDTAVALFTLAADMGYPDAIYHHALAHVEKSLERSSPLLAISLYREAVSRGSSKALSDPAKHYFDDPSLDQTTQAADLVEIFTRAKKCESSGGIADLAGSLLKSYGRTDQDIKLGIVLLKHAAQLGSFAARFDLNTYSRP
jgi:hypothetical protein